jgi:uncharacterized Zn finger protein
MTRENAEAKGRRYLVEGRVVVVTATPGTATPGYFLATVRGNGAAHSVRYGRGGWSCTCDARSICSHLVAARLIAAPDAAHLIRPERNPLAMNNKQMPTLEDARRAAALVVHFGRRDAEGVNEVIAQVNEDLDPQAATARLLFGVLELYAGILPALHTARGLALLNTMVVDLSRVDLGDQQ